MGVNVDYLFSTRTFPSLVFSFSLLYTEDELIPRVLIEILSCGCTKKCGNACGCRKAGLKCSILCKICLRETCTNSREQVLVDALEDDNDDDFRTIMLPLSRTELKKRRVSESPEDEQNFYDDGD